MLSALKFKKVTLQPIKFNVNINHLFARELAIKNNPIKQTFLIKYA
jgi:hypothetical protein